MCGCDPNTAVTEEALSEIRGDPEALVALVLQQAAVIVELRGRVAELEARLENDRPPPPAAPFRRRSYAMAARVSWS